MQLTFHSTFLSIKDFPNVSLPGFTLITGLNGTGKSHVLKAIKEGHIRNDVTTDFKEEIRLYDWTNLMPNDQGAFDGRAWINQRLGTFDNFLNQSRLYGGHVLDAARAAGVPTRHLTDAASVATLTLDELTQLIGDAKRAANAHQEISKAAQQASSQIAGHIQGQQRTEIDLVSRTSMKPIVALRQEDFFLDREDRWGRVDMFQQSLGQLFVAYRDLALKNALKLRAREQGEANDALSEKEFLERHMMPPWAFVNETLASAHLDFKVDKPDLFDYVPYRPRLKKTSTGAELFFSDLSSGEKILMSLALCLYYTEDTRQITNYPKILLLDEVDAPLHPSMSRLYLDVLSKTVVQKHKIHVIATTHSPSTVALAPEDTLYVIERDQAGLQKTTKSHALNILTDAVPTLAISYDGRRQVFVESPNDAQIYDAIYNSLKSRLGSERSLEFVATGIRREATLQHLNTGCDVVRYLVGALADAGNQSVFGLIDWDGKNEPAKRICVLAHKQRNGLENVILDPLLLSALIAGYDRSSVHRLSNGPDISYPNFLLLRKNELQPFATKVQEAVLGRPSRLDVECRYLGDFSLLVDREYLELDDHKLEHAVLDAFPALRSLSKDRVGALMLSMASTVLKDQPDFAPSELFDVLAELLNRESH